MRVYDWDAIERQHQHVGRLIGEGNYAGVVGEYRNIAKTIGWSDGSEAPQEAELFALRFWMMATSIPVKHHAAIEDEFTKTEN
tara:strand:- start:363 stop:611 length:249 start_codon:yes stop_codon:yes gene_type:complete